MKTPSVTVHTRHWWFGDAADGGHTHSPCSGSAKSTTGPPGTSPCSVFTAQTCASVYTFSDTCVLLTSSSPFWWQCLEGRCQACPHLCCLSGLAVADAWECGRKSWGHSCVWVLVCSCVSAGKAWWFLYLSGSRASSREEHRYHFSFLIVPKPRFQTSTLFISDLVILCCRGCPVYCGLLSSVPELDLLDPSSIASQ